MMNAAISLGIQIGANCTVIRNAESERTEPERNNGKYGICQQVKIAWNVGSKCCWTIANVRSANSTVLLDADRESAEERKQNIQADYIHQV